MKERPIQTPTKELISKCDAPNQFKNFDNLFRQVMSVPKSAVDREESKLKRKKKRVKKPA